MQCVGSHELIDLPHTPIRSREFTKKESSQGSTSSPHLVAATDPVGLLFRSAPSSLPGLFEGEAEQSVAQQCE